MERRLSREFLSLPFLFGFDIDGVLADSRNIGVKIFNEIVGTNYKPEDVVSYDQLTIWAIANGKSPEEAYVINRRVWDSPEVLSQSTLIDGAGRLFKYMYDRGLKPPIITTRISTLRDSTFAWVHSQIPCVEAGSLYMGKHLHIDAGIPFKIGSIKRLGIRYFVEDHPGTAEAILTGTDANVLMVRHPFNAGYQFPREFNNRVYWIHGKDISIPTLTPILDVLKEIYL